MGCFCPNLLGWLSAIRAEPKNVDIVARLGKSVVFGHLIGPFFKVLGLNFQG
jgi:hypothetical protein